MSAGVVSQQLAPAVGGRVVVTRISTRTTRFVAQSSSASISHKRVSRVTAAASATAASAGVVAASRPNGEMMHHQTRHRDNHRHHHHHHHRGSYVVVRASDAAAAPATDGGDGKKMTTFVAGILWFFAHQLIGVGNDVIMKYTGSTLGVAQVVFLRFAFATLTMLPVMLASGNESFKTDRIPLHIARSVLLAAGITLYCQGLSIAPIAVVTTLNFTIPLFTLVMARIFLKETVDATRWIGTLVGFGGVMVVVQPGGAAFNPMWQGFLGGRRGGREANRVCPTRDCVDTPIPEHRTHPPDPTTQTPNLTPKESGWHLPLPIVSTGPVALKRYNVKTSET